VHHPRAQFVLPLGQQPHDVPDLHMPGHGQPERLQAAVRLGAYFRGL